MIKTEQEYQNMLVKHKEEMKRLKDQEIKLKSSGMSAKHIKLALDPLRSFFLQLEEEIKEYENIKRGNFSKVENFNGVGRLLIAYRIYKGIKQSELAEMLEVEQSQISRDERNEYRGASIEKINNVMKAMGLKTETNVLNSSLDAAI